MTFYFDTEFIERIHCPLLGKSRHVIDLISISIVAANGATYNAISSEYNYNDASKWVKDNVIVPLYVDTVHGDQRNHEQVETFQKGYGKTNKRIAEEIKAFVYEHSGIGNPNSISNWSKVKYLFPIKFVGYYCDYDWVLLCSLFGTMIDLPLGFPMYCTDLKQTLDEKVNHIFYRLTPLMDDEMRVMTKFEEKLSYIKAHADYPKQEKEHLSKYDALWNRDLDTFLKRF